MKLLKYALDNHQYELAAHALVYGMLKAKIEQNSRKKKNQRKSK